MNKLFVEALSTQVHPIKKAIMVPDICRRFSSGKSMVSIYMTYSK